MDKCKYGINMIKRIVIKDGKKYIVNVPTWDDMPTNVEQMPINEQNVNNVPPAESTIPLEPEANQR